jgi:hypothetical protein
MDLPEKCFRYDATALGDLPGFNSRAGRLVLQNWELLPLPLKLCFRFPVSRFDRLIDHFDALLVRLERAFHRVDGELFHIIDGYLEDVLRNFIFIRHVRIAHEPVIGVERDPEFILVV